MRNPYYASTRRPTGLKVMNLHMTVCEECQMPHCIHYLEPVRSLLGAMLDLPWERLSIHPSGTRKDHKAARKTGGRACRERTASVPLRVWLAVGHITATRYFETRTGASSPFFFFLPLFLSLSLNHSFILLFDFRRRQPHHHYHLSPSYPCI